MYIKTEESFNFYSHLVGVAAFAIGTVFLISVASGSLGCLLTSIVYGISGIFMFSASSLYHAFKKHDNEISFWRRMDRMAIFFMIAGSYTPVCYIYLEGPWRWGMIIAQWSLVGLGLLTQIFLPRASRVLYAAIYSLMGWLLIFNVRDILAVMPQIEIILLFVGGAAFTLGAIMYASKMPRLVPGRFSSHELFHIMVLIGVGCHYGLIYNAVFNVSA